MIEPQDVIDDIAVIAPCATIFFVQAWEKLLEYFAPSGAQPLRMASLRGGFARLEHSARFPRRTRATSRLSLASFFRPLARDESVQRNVGAEPLYKRDTLPESKPTHQAQDVVLSIARGTPAPKE